VQTVPRQREGSKVAVYAGSTASRLRLSATTIRFIGWPAAPATLPINIVTKVLEVGPSQIRKGRQVETDTESKGKHESRERNALLCERRSSCIASGKDAVLPRCRS